MKFIQVLLTGLIAACGSKSKSDDTTALPVAAEMPTRSETPPKSETPGSVTPRPIPAAVNEDQIRIDSRRVNDDKNVRVIRYSQVTKSCESIFEKSISNLKKGLGAAEVVNELAVVQWDHTIGFQYSYSVGQLNPTIGQRAGFLDVSLIKQADSSGDLQTKFEQGILSAEPLVTYTLDSNCASDKILFISSFLLIMKELSDIGARNYFFRIRRNNV